MIKDDELLEKYNTIWEKVSADIKKKLIVSLRYRFLPWKVPKLDSNHTSLAVISLYSILKKNDNYYQVFSKECKYIEKKVIRHININYSDLFILLMSLMFFVKAILKIYFFIWYKLYHFLRFFNKRLLTFFVIPTPKRIP